MDRPSLMRGAKWATDDNADPVFRYEPLWRDDIYYYFFDETWTEIHGPFFSEIACRDALRKYGDKL